MVIGGFISSVSGAQCSSTARNIIARFLDGIKQQVDAVRIPPQLAFREEYLLETDANREPAITTVYAVMQIYNLAFTDIISSGSNSP